MPEVHITSQSSIISGRKKVVNSRRIVNIILALILLILFSMPWFADASGYDIWNSLQMHDYRNGTPFVVHSMLLGGLVAPIAIIILALRGNEGLIMGVLRVAPMVMIMTLTEETKVLPFFSGEWGFYAYIFTALLTMLLSTIYEYIEDSEDK